MSEEVSQGTEQQNRLTESPEAQAVAEDATTQPAPEESAIPSEQPQAEIQQVDTQSSSPADAPISEIPPTPSAELPPNPADQEVAAAMQAETSGGSASERIRQKLGVRTEDRAVGTQDLPAVQRETPSADKQVEIPRDADLDSDLEAEIAAAMGGVSEPVTTINVPAADGGEDGAAGAKTEPQEIGPGSRLTGIVQLIHDDDVFLNAGLLSDVVISLKQFPADKPPVVGDTLKVVVDHIDADGLTRARLPHARSKAGGNWDALSVGQVVDAQVTAVNKGGLQVTVSGLKGFLPASQIELGFVSDLEQYVGQKLSVKVTEVKPKKRNLVVSRKALLVEERDQNQASFWETVEVGQDHTGVVKTLKNYGAFVNIGPIDGFLHIGEISWSRINHPNEVLQEGQEVQVRILKYEREKNRISLGMKQLVQNPWQGLAERYPSERIVTGRVSRIADFGAFIELEPGVEGMVHVSELAWRRVGSVGEVLKVGDEKDFKVLEVDGKRRRVSLSLKALEQKPESAKKEEPVEEERPVRKPNADLRGGMGRASGAGGLFGNPSDFS
ncbi:MAG: S1 RNA-binding domain-containing protein [Planctomycetaceae bacterium]